jgi:hypothetical protein
MMEAGEELSVLLLGGFELELFGEDKNDLFGIVPPSRI